MQPQRTQLVWSLSCRVWDTGFGVWSLGSCESCDYIKKAPVPERPEDDDD